MSFEIGAWCWIAILGVLMMAGCGQQKQDVVDQPEPSVVQHTTGDNSPAIAGTGTVILRTPVTGRCTKHHWKRAHESERTEEHYVCDATERIEATITQYDRPSGQWYVWHNGAGYGEYLTKQAAIAQAEKIAAQLGENTF